MASKRSESTPPKGGEKPQVQVGPLRVAGLYRAGGPDHGLNYVLVYPPGSEPTHLDSLTKLHGLTNLDGLTKLDELHTLTAAQGEELAKKAFIRRGVWSNFYSHERSNLEEGVIKYLLVSGLQYPEAPGNDQAPEQTHDEDGSQEDWEKITLEALKLVQSELDRGAADHIKYVRDRLKPVLENVQS